MRVENKVDWLVHMSTRDDSHREKRVRIYGWAVSWCVEGQLTGKGRRGMLRYETDTGPGFRQAWIRRAYPGALTSGYGQCRPLL